MPSGHHVHGLVEASAARAPLAVAVVDRDRSLTYRELDEQANRVAHQLVDLGVRRGDRVGLFLDKSIESVVGIYGVLKAGAAYVPLDPKAPVARAAFITGNCTIRVLLSGVEKRSAWSELVAEGSPVEVVVCLNGPASGGPGEDGEHASDVRVIGRDEVDRLPATPVDRPVVDLDLAYILYTSGSTGMPKGVKLTHLNALSFVEWAGDEFALTSADRVSSHAPLHFDLSVFDLYAAHRAGAALVLVPPRTSTFPMEVARFIRSNGITVWYSVPSILSMMIERGGLEPDDFPALRTILFAGEVFPTKYLRRLMELLPHVRFANLYGPTETNVCTWYDVLAVPEGDDPIPIGRAIDNVEVFAVTDDGRRADVGEVGELYVRGTTVMSGYWADPQRTAKGLVRHPFDPELVDLAYRTGDLVREDDRGDYEFLGRRDSQIKSRGYRIELGDIETAILAHPDVAEAAVIAVPDELVTNRIRAFVAPRPEVGVLDVAALCRFCADRIPAYMIPESFEVQDALPKTSTGKIDRQSLRASVS